ncbi:hypothetical protein [Roseibium sp. Sym1]|uniref:hypothetical protein n=1 Tax=Roseibium sp. Sym1 TaxID=3016006 RepID=UPI0022B35368|nr:hypothetical protein [Roseibium sp. Sym1]
MKLPDSETYNSPIYADILQNLTTNQLAWIGALAMRFNQAEQELYLVFNRLVDYEPGAQQISSRINGLDGIVEIVSLGVKSLFSDKQVHTLTEQTLKHQGFSTLKSFRDGVIHARIINAQRAIGKTTGRRGKQSHILLTDEALKGVCDRLLFVLYELSALTVLIPLKRKKLRRYEGRVLNQEQREEAIQDAIARYQLHQNHRLSLPPLPELQEESLMQYIAPYRPKTPILPPGERG